MRSSDWSSDVCSSDLQLHIVTSLDDNAEVLLQNCEHFKFAEIVQTAPGKYKLAGDYVPTSVALAASSNLLRWTRAMRDLLVSRRQDFAAPHRPRRIPDAATSPPDVVGHLSKEETRVGYGRGK